MTSRGVSEGALMILRIGVWIWWLKCVSGQFLVFVLQLFLCRSSLILFHFNYFSYYIISEAVVDTTAYNINLITCFHTRITVESCLGHLTGCHIAATLSCSLQVKSLPHVVPLPLVLSGHACTLSCWHDLHVEFTPIIGITTAPLPAVVYACN